MSRRAIIFYGITWSLVTLFVLGVYRLSLQKEQKQQKQTLQKIAEVAASGIVGEDHEAIEIEDPDDVLMGFFYPGVQYHLREVRNNYNLKTPISTLRPIENSDRALYIVTTAQVHRIGAEAPFPKEARQVFESGQSAVTPMYQREHGEQWITAYAPIRNSQNAIIALTRVDQQTRSLLAQEHQGYLIRLIILFGGGAFLYILLAAIIEVAKRGFRGAIIKGFLGKLGVQLGVSFALLIALGVSISTTFSYITSRQALVDSIGEKLRATVYLGALTVDSEKHKLAFNNGVRDPNFDDQLNYLVETVGKIQERSGLLTDIYTVAIANEAPMVVATSEEGIGFGKEIQNPRPELIKAFEKGVPDYTALYPSKLLNASDKSIYQVSAYAPIVDSNRRVVAVLVADQDVTPLLTELLNQLLQSVLYGLSGVLLAVAISLFFTRAISKPLKSLNHVCEQIGYGNFDVSIPSVKRRDELGKLGKTLQHMMVELKQRDERIERDAQVRSNYERFFPPQILAKATKDEDLLRPGGGRELSVTVLFADIRNYTALSQNMPPREVAEMLNEYFTTIVAEVFRYGGTLEKYIGDAMMAIWGAPFPSPKPVPSAIKASIAMQQAIRTLNQHWKQQGRQWHLEVGIGINTGVCFVGNIGTADYLQYAAIGATTNMSARLCSLAGPGEIVLSQNACQEITQQKTLSYRVEKMPPFLAKGFDTPSTPYRILWEPEEQTMPQQRTR